MQRRLTDADLAEIMRKQGLPVDFKFRANPKKSAGPSESQIQQQLGRWWHVACKEFCVPERMLFAVPLQAARSPQNGARMKAEMARAGTPDLLLLVPRGRYHGAAIEMKRPGGRVSPEQVEFMDRLTEYGYFASVCYSVDEAVLVITQYLRPHG